MGPREIVDTAQGGWDHTFVEFKREGLNYSALQDTQIMHMQRRNTLGEHVSFSSGIGLGFKALVGVFRGVRQVPAPRDIFKALNPKREKPDPFTMRRRIATTESFLRI